MTAKELLNYYFNEWIENGCECSFSSWAENDGEFQAEHLDESEETEFSTLYQKVLDNFD